MRKLFVLLFSAVLLSLAVGCAQLPSGVKFSEEEKKSCAEQYKEIPCTVWTVQELNQLHIAGYKKGWGEGRRILIQELEQKGMLRSHPANAL